MVRSEYTVATLKRRCSKKEFARRGDALLKKIRPTLAAADDDKFIAIDIETGEYEIDRNELKACDRLEKRLADAQIWIAQVGSGYLDRLGSSPPRGPNRCNYGSPIGDSFASSRGDQCPERAWGNVGSKLANAAIGHGDEHAA
jgi:hypothetical protein